MRLPGALVGYSGRSDTTGPPCISHCIHLRKPPRQQLLFFRYLFMTLAPTVGSGLWPNFFLRRRSERPSANPYTADCQVASWPHIPWHGPRVSERNYISHHAVQKWRLSEATSGPLLIVRKLSTAVRVPEIRAETVVSFSFRSDSSTKKKKFYYLKELCSVYRLQNSR